MLIFIASCTYCSTYSIKANVKQLLISYCSFIDIILFIFTRLLKRKIIADIQTIIIVSIGEKSEWIEFKLPATNIVSNIYSSITSDCFSKIYIHCTCYSQILSTSIPPTCSDPHLAD